MFGWLKALCCGAEDEAGEAVGRLENAAHCPLWPIEHYQSVVSVQLIRGSWPNLRELHGLKVMSIKAVLNLCSERTHDIAVKQAGLKPFNRPITDNTCPTESDLEYALRLIKTEGPLFVHCEAGKGRTGCIVAGYRVRVQGWEAEHALQEAEHFGLVMPCQKQWILKLKR